MFSSQVENTVGKGEIARYEQFLLFPRCFQKDLYCKHVKPGLVWERDKTWMRTEKKSCEEEKKMKD